MKEDEPHVFTIGIEEEFQIVDPETRELRSHIQEILAQGKMILKEQVKPEMHQSVVELGTEICRNVSEARQQVVQLRSELARLAARDRLRIASAGTHPFSHWMDQLITADERYATIVNDMQQIARANLIFGLHVHIGIPDREEGVQLMNQARYFLPHLYALSTNSPFRAPASPTSSKVSPNTRITWSCLFRRTASITRKRFGGTSAFIRSSTRSSSGFATRSPAWRTPSRWPP
jgi:YbdK family carboxylate-amine ligase